jgi:hypothetical protein
MRPVDQGDIAAAARAVMHLAATERMTRLERLFAVAHAADIYRKRTGRVHRLWGNGTLYAAAFAGCQALPPRSDLSDPGFVLALGDVLDALILWRSLRESRRRRGVD